MTDEPVSSRTYKTLVTKHRKAVEDSVNLATVVRSTADTLLSRLVVLASQENPPVDEILTNIAVSQMCLAAFDEVAAHVRRAVPHTSLTHAATFEDSRTFGRDSSVTRWFRRIRKGWHPDKPVSGI